MQMTIDDFLAPKVKAHEGQVDPERLSLIDRMSALVPGWEIAGYKTTYSWTSLGVTDYSTMIWNPAHGYHLVMMEIGKKDRLNYVERSDFEPSWFEKGTWHWVTESHRKGAYEAAKKNIGVFSRLYYFKGG